MNSIEKKAEACGNVAIIIVAIVVIAFVINRTVLHPQNSDGRSGFKTISVGTRVALPNIDWSKNANTLLLVLAKGCHFCSDSAPFYQRLASEISGRKNVQIIALLPQNENEGRGYLGDLKVPITDVRHASLDDLGVPGTPTLILVNNSGIATKVWIGRLLQDQEDEVFSAIKSSVASQDLNAYRQ